MLRQTKEGWWIIDGDTHLSKWVEESGRIDHDEFLVPQLRLLIQPGTAVIDIGANIGTHTVAYSEVVGEDGCVLSFEPNPQAHEALLKNMEKGAKSRWSAYSYALSDQAGKAYLMLDSNAGASHIATCPATPQEGMWAFIEVRTLDEFLPDLRIPGVGMPLSYVKIDAEGFEFKILKGAEAILRLHRPVILLEINTQRLRENGTEVFEILSWLTKTIGNYQHRLIPQGADYRDSQYDILVMPLPNPPSSK